ncbi:MAG: prenyltransferase, partial [Acidimicrobiales bacterium]
EGVRCVSDRPWVTAAETCEAALAHLAVGDRTTALELFSWAQEMREPDGRYITGLVHPDRALFPPGERSTYSAAAAILAADAIGDCTPAAGLFRDHDLLPAIIDVDPDQIDAPARD